MDLQSTTNDGISQRCRSLIEGSIRRNIGDSLLLSGGLDTSIIAHVSGREGFPPRCFTVHLEHRVAPDVFYANTVAKRLGLDWTLVELREEELEERLTQVIGTLRSFDPMEVRNSVAVLHGMMAAREGGCSKIMTGDAADELFAGYNFSFNLRPEEMMQKLRALWEVMHFSSLPMAEAMGMEASLPYLDREVVRFAETLKPKTLVGVRRGRKYGKLVLRRAFERMVGKRIAWRNKMPIEYGSGTTFLSSFYSTRITDGEFLRRRRQIRENDGVKLRDKEQLAYYEIYRKGFPPPGQDARSAHGCPACGADQRPGSSFCVTCGAYPVEAVRR